MATVNFLYRSTKKDKAKLHLRLLYRFDNIDYVIGTNTKFEIEYLSWFGHHAEIKENKAKGIKAITIKGTKDVDIINERLRVNNELNKIENHILKAFNLINPTSVNKEWLQSEIEYYYNPLKEAEPLSNELIKYFDYFIENKKTEITNGTLIRYNSTKKLLEKYQNEFKEKINIIDVNDKFKTDFEKFCIKNNYAFNTISKNLKIIKTVCYNAKHNGIQTSHQLNTIKTPQQKTEKIYLTFEDLALIETIDKSKLTESLENAKDWLIISCYTGQRVSDFMRFDKNMIRHEKNKAGILKPFIEFTQVKTNKLMTVVLHPKVIEILSKRNGNFPKAIKDQKYNLYIKTVCQIAELNEEIKGSKLIDLNKEENELKKAKNKKEIKQYRKEANIYKKWELVTSHIGRRSFATNFYGTIPTTYLINVTGHQTEQMFLNYIGKSNKDLAMELTNYF
jgi:integrase